MQIFQKNILNKYIESLGDELIAERYQQFADYFLNPDRQENIHNSKEEQFQEGFLRELFVKILGYTLNPDPDFNLTTEKKNETNSKKADGAILVNGKVVGVVELKDHKTTDLSKVEAQAFNYKSQHKEAVYVVISNFEKLRFYIDNAVDFEEFDLFHLTKDDFARLWICLAYENIEKNLPKQIKAASLTNEDQITNALYKDYSNFKRDLFDDILQHNPNTCVSDNGACPVVPTGQWELLLFKKTQKLLDRLLFIFFAEDRGLLPPNSIMLIIDQWEKLKELDEYQPFYNRLKKYFGYMNTGFQGKNYEVFAYNGGLFKPDEVLDELTISDDVLKNYCKKIADYDFASDVDVNILGHIFENSLTEIEEVTTRLRTMGHDPLADAPLSLSKRKKDGVFYTPQYITKYIVENTVGKLCKEKKAELGIDESEYFTDKKRQTATKKTLIEKLDAYRDWLLQISICDPACGSGAFLNAALDFLITEHKLIDEMSAKVAGESIVFPNIENSILENNLYGVDINEESVEIAKLSLWLRTAKPHRKLNSLNNNIKCGNSLIDDPAIAGEKAFCWEKEFPQVFREKQKKAWHITTAVHDSRTSERMVEYEVRRLRDHGTRPYPEPMLLSEEEEIIITETVSKIVREDKLNLLAYNICFDHMHLLLVCEEEEVPKIVGKIKSMTARAVNIAMGRTMPTTETPAGTTAAATAGHDPLSLPDASLPDDELPKKGIPQCSLWTRKFGNTYIDSEEHLYNAIQYIQTNREHHDLPPLPVEYPPCVSIEEAFRPEYTGGFDVVIGNPPYVHLESVIETSSQLEKSGYTTYNKRGDLYCVFVERAFQLAKKNAFVSYIMPNKWLQAGYGKELRAYFLKKRLEKLIDFGDIQIFEGATTYPCIFIGRNTLPAEKLSVSVLDAAHAQDFSYNVQSNEEIFDLSQFSSDTWVISSQKEKALIERLSKSYKTLSDTIGGEAYYGLKTGLSEAFLISAETYESIVGKDEKAKEHIFPFLQGRHVRPYAKAEAVSYLILFEKGWTQREKTFANETDAWNYLKASYPSIAEWLEPFAEKGRNRTDKGDFWWELRACDYYDKFAKPKIMYQKFQVKPCFVYVEEELFCNDSMWFISTESKALLAILNSKMGWWLITKYCSQIQNGYQLIWKYFGQIPIPPLGRYDRDSDSEACRTDSGRYDRGSDSGTCRTDSGRYDRSSDSGTCPAVPIGRYHAGLSELADSMLSLNVDLQQKRQRFLRRLQDNLGVQKVTAALERFDELDFKVFVVELKKQKISLSLAQQDEWEDYFNQYKADCNALSAQIAATDKEIDQMVYELYGLTEDEIKVVEGE